MFFSTVSVACLVACVAPASGSTPVIDRVYYAQTHVLAPDDEYFKLVGQRGTLLKAQVLGADGETQAPVVKAMVTSQGKTFTLILTGPAVLPKSWEGGKGLVEHKHEDSFTATIPAEHVLPGMTVNIIAGAATTGAQALKVGAPSVITMRMFDVHYFGLDSRFRDYDDGWEAELGTKWPVAELNVDRIRGLDFLELVVPARGGGTVQGEATVLPAVRVASKLDYEEKTGQSFDGEQAAALAWVHALSVAGGNQDTAMCYVNIIGVPAGGQAGGFDGVGSPGLGILNHELGHALSLPHWGGSGNYPYRGDMHGVAGPSTGTHVGPAWAFDLPSMTFIPPTCEVGKTLRCEAPDGSNAKFVYKASPMQGGGTGDQEPQFLFRHFADYGTNQMQSYIEGKLAVNAGSDANPAWFKWDDSKGTYSRPQTGAIFPRQTNVEVYSLMAATMLDTARTVSMAYPAIGPYTASLVPVYTVSQGAAANAANYCPSQGCDFSLRVEQGGKTTVYMLPAYGVEGADPKVGSSLKTTAINVPASSGEVLSIQLLHTPNVEDTGVSSDAEVLHSWEEPRAIAHKCGDTHLSATDPNNLLFGAAKHVPTNTNELADYVNFQSAKGDWIEWAVEECKDERYTLFFDYYAGMSDRPMKVVVNGVTVAERLGFPQTDQSGKGAFVTKGTTKGVEVALQGGKTHVVKLESVGLSGHNIVRLSLYRQGQVPAGNAGIHTDDRDKATTATFHVKGLGGKSCPDGQVTSTADGCRYAAGGDLGMPFSKQVNDLTGRPAGCFHDLNGYLYFNQALATTEVWSGTGGVCRITATLPPLSATPTLPPTPQTTKAPVTTPSPPPCPNMNDVCEGKDVCKVGCPCPACPSKCWLGQTECPTGSTCVEGDGCVKESAPPTCTALCKPQRGLRPVPRVVSKNPKLFLVAGQSNAEGNVFLSGLRKLAAVLPKGTTAPLTAAQRTAARDAVKNSQGGGGCKTTDYRENTADAVIDGLVASSFDWQAIDSAGTLPAIEMASFVYKYAPVTVHEKLDPTTKIGAWTFNMADSGKKCSIDSGWGSAITTAARCFTAAKAIGKAFAKSVNSDDRPEGCWLDPNQLVYFNSNTSPTSPWASPKRICKKESPSDGVHDAVYCEALCRSWVEGETNSDGATGCYDFTCGENKMLTCAQACRARRQDVPELTCSESCTASAQAKTCTFDIGPLEFDTCSTTCDTVGEKCNNPSTKGCLHGCKAASGASGLAIDSPGATGELVADKCSADRSTTAQQGPPMNSYRTATQTFAPLKAGHGGNSNTDPMYGPELSFGHVMAAGLPSNENKVLKVAMGGASLGDHWRPSGPMYKTLLKETRAALQASEKEGLELGGLVWFQGYNDQYSDSYCDALYPKYEANLREFISNIRRDLGAPGLPIVVVKARNGGQMATIRAAQDAVTDTPGVSTVESNDTSECYHYDSGAQLVIGERAAKAMLEQINN